MEHHHHVNDVSDYDHGGSDIDVNDFAAIRDELIDKYRGIDPATFHDKHISFHDDGDYCAFYNEYVHHDHRRTDIYDAYPEHNEHAVVEWGVHIFSERRRRWWRRRPRR